MNEPGGASQRWRGGAKQTAGPLTIQPGPFGELHASERPKVKEEREQSQ